MENIARAILKINGKFVFIKRENKPNCEYKIFYSFPGGHLEKGETFEQACIREIEEELGVKIKISKEYFETQINELNKFEKYYIVEYVSGVLGSGKGEEFTQRNIEKYGSYEVFQISKSDFEKYDILPTQLKEKMMNDEEI